MAIKFFSNGIDFFFGFFRKNQAQVLFYDRFSVTNDSV